MFVHPSHEDRSGGPFCTITQHRSGLATSYQVSFGNLLLDLHRGVGERRQEPPVVALEGLGGPTRGGQGTAAWEEMVHELRVKHAVRCRQVVLVLAHLDKASDHLLVVFHRHAFPPLSSHCAEGPARAVRGSQSEIDRFVASAGVHETGRDGRSFWAKLGLSPTRDKMADLCARAAAHTTLKQPLQRSKPNWTES